VAPLQCRGYAYGSFRPNLLSNKGLAESEMCFVSICALPVSSFSDIVPIPYYVILLQDAVQGVHSGTRLRLDYIQGGEVYRRFSRRAARRRATMVFASTIWPLWTISAALESRTTSRSRISSASTDDSPSVSAVATKR
jgi:hypothetical protein